MAGRPRTPTNILELRGTQKNAPARARERKKEPKNTKPLGQPYSFLAVAEKRVWRILAKECIPGTLGAADRFALAMASQLGARCIDGTANHQDRTLMHRYLTQFGMTPADRSKITVLKDGPGNKFDD